MDTDQEFHPVRSKYLIITADYLLPVLICCTVLALWYVIFHTNIFTVRTIICNADHRPCQDLSLLDELDKYRGQNLFTLSPDALSRRLESADYTVQSAVVTRVLPSTLVVELSSVSPAVALQVSGQSQWIVLDAKFRPLGTRDIDPNVPTLMVPAAVSLPVGRPVADATLLAALTVARELGSTLPSVKTITLTDPESLRLTLTSGQYVLMTTRRPVAAQISLLQAVLKDATMAEGKAGIDVRFNQPVLIP